MVTVNLTDFSNHKKHVINMEIDNCHHEWDHTQNEYLPVVESIKKHHACKDCGLINHSPQTTHLKTGKLIALIKEMFEKNNAHGGKSTITLRTSNK
ncbi:hypothetical protein [Methanococcoides burtonii]|uniref:Uncharacterized protein n=1 Tax=Methanococcoides burtonii (strain DSM 6242 / NBRC 107633 / OCM 468 / ACE-M) TaxID=259564 RepID=Q12TX8_METBU|nr:hypothetical protein [Methanococcoides burtonii]ABE53098.1 Hypothetical protein Mbur_2235 [Methanococcoides burtonii DSM 6242]